MDAKTAVDTIFVGRDRACNRRFQQMCGRYLVNPVACTPASGWEKGQVENQAGVVRRRFFVPRPKFKNYAELNAWLEDRCVARAKSHPHQELRDRTIWEAFEDERASLVPYVGSFDDFHAVPASVSKTCLVWFGKNRCPKVFLSAIALAANVIYWPVFLSLALKKRINGRPSRVL